MTTEDLQEKYRDKHKELKPSVPLAADSAHLLTEYLDSISVEFVKQGVMEPYRITRELEEILVGELQQQGSKYKLTYEVTSKVLEKYGSPVQVVAKYIKENNPKLHPILVPADSTTTTQSNNNPKMKKPSIITRFTQGITWVIFLSTIVYFGSILLSLLTEDILLNLRSYDFVVLSQALVPFLFLEVITSWKGYAIDKKYYHTLRETIRFLISCITLVGLMWFVNMHNLSLVGVIVPWILVYGIGLLKDRTDLLQSSSPRQKPIARFVLPSYIVTGLAYIAALMLLYSQNNYTAFQRYESPDYFLFQTSGSLITLVLFLSILGIILDFGRKYPLSLKKLGYNIVFYFFIFYVNTYKLYYFKGRPYYGWVTEIITNYPVIFPTAIIYTIALAIVVPLLFRREIKIQLAEYRNSLQNSLDDYRL